MTRPRSAVGTSFSRTPGSMPPANVARGPSMHLRPRLARERLCGGPARGPACRSSPQADPSRSDPLTFCARVGTKRPNVARPRRWRRGLATAGARAGCAALRNGVSLRSSRNRRARPNADGERCLTQHIDPPTPIAPRPPPRSIGGTRPRGQTPDRTPGHSGSVESDLPGSPLSMLA